SAWCCWSWRWSARCLWYGRSGRASSPETTDDRRPAYHEDGRPPARPATGVAAPPGIQPIRTPRVVAARGPAAARRIVADPAGDGGGPVVAAHLQPLHDLVRTVPGTADLRQLPADLVRPPDPATPGEQHPDHRTVG